MVKCVSNYSSEFFYKLKTASGFSFPLKCPKCGKDYKTAEEFVQNTLPVENLENVFESYDSNKRRILEVVRACHCGKVILEEFFSRRDSSLEGIERRAEFSHYLHELRGAGMKKEEAHSELLGLVNGQHSYLMDRLGIEFTQFDA